jgi:hypothetical protein
MAPFYDTNKSIVVRGESNFHENVDSNLPGISLTGQDTFINVCNNCIFRGNNNLH